MDEQTKRRKEFLKDVLYRSPDKTAFTMFIELCQVYEAEISDLKCKLEADTKLLAK